MWKIFFEYSDKSKCTLTGRQKDIPLDLAVKYDRKYNRPSAKATYQQYPKRNHEAMSLGEKIEQLRGEF